MCSPGFCWIKYFGWDHVRTSGPEIDLTLMFLTPAFPDDIRVMVRPITYLAWDVKSHDGAKHDVAIYLDADGALATDSRDEPVTW